MTDDSALITRPRDYSKIANLQDPGVLEEFLNKPLTFIAETIIGAIAVEKNGLFLSGGRIVQALLKGRLFQQWAAEFKKLRETGRIPDDFADKKYGFQTWVELMTIIDEESPDADRLEALKAMFFAVNKVETTDGEKIKAYQLWQIAKRLNSGELLLLKTAYENRDRYGQDADPKNKHSFSNWTKYMSSAVGHSSEGLIALYYKQPAALGLLSESVQNALGSFISPTNAGLTELGFMFCANIEAYEIEMRVECDAE
jgi:hypothetical protein